MVALAPLLPETLVSATTRGVWICSYNRPLPNARTAEQHCGVVAAVSLNSESSSVLGFASARVSGPCVFEGSSDRIICGLLHGALGRHAPIF